MRNTRSRSLKKSRGRCFSSSPPNSKLFKKIGTISASAILLVLVLFSTVKLHYNYKVSNSLHQPSQSRKGFIDNPPVLTAAPYQDIVLAHCQEDLKWLDQLHNFDPSVCSHTKIHIYSKCNAEINLTEVMPLRKMFHCQTNQQLWY